MDALALLCTLHADGPTTLKRLRRSGCGDLASLIAMDTESTSRLLEVSPAIARRLGREARHLALRVGLGEREMEEAPYGPYALERPSAEVPAPPSPREPRPEPERDDVLGRKDREILDTVLERWREDDHAATEPLTERFPGIESDDLAEPEGLVDAGDEEPEHEEPQHELPRPELLPGSLEGLDERIARRMQSLGIRAFKDLAQSDAAALVSPLGLPFSEVRRLQFLASRAPRAEPPERTVEKRSWALSPDPPPALPAPALTSSPGPGTPADPTTAGTVLNWDFEIRPAPRPDPMIRPGESREEAGGPFA